MIQPLLELKGIYKTYNRVVNILNNIDLSIFPGQLISIVGVSGSGKSTLLQIAGLLDNYDKGSINFKFNDSCLNLSPDKIRLKYMGFVYQYHYLFKNFNVLENVLVPAIINGATFSQARVKAEHLLEQVSMIDKKDAYPITLSGGQAQRVSIARALINNPSLIIADEPTGNLDKENSNNILSLLRSFANKGSACIFATHDLTLANLSDATYTLSYGKLTLHK
jgi:lipoprotein-releasing system ATP-binding protein